MQKIYEIYDIFLAMLTFHEPPSPLLSTQFVNDPLQLQYWNIDCPDDLNVYIGTSTSSYHSNVICGEDTNGNTWNYDTDMLYLYWYTNSYDNERGFYGYVRRVD